MFAPVIDDLQMETIPTWLWKESFQVSLRHGDVLSARKAPPLGEPMNMRVHRKSGMTKCLRHDDGSRFVTDSRQGFQFIEGSRHFPLVFFQDDL